MKSSSIKNDDGAARSVDDLNEKLLETLIFFFNENVLFFIE